MVYSHPFRSGTRGVRVVTNAERNAVDAEALVDVRQLRGRRNGVVLAHPCCAKSTRSLKKPRGGDGGKRWFTGESAYKP